MCPRADNSGQSGHLMDQRPVKSGICGRDLTGMANSHYQLIEMGIACEETFKGWISKDMIST